MKRRELFWMLMCLLLAGIAGLAHPSNLDAFVKIGGVRQPRCNPMTVSQNGIR